MRYTRSLAGQLCSQRWIARCNQSPGINKYLSADLLRYCTSILRNAAASRCRYAAAQVQICRMLRTRSVTAPPEKSMLIGCVI